MSSIFTPVTKKSFRVDKVEDLARVLPDAFALMKSGRPGPVHMDMPYNLYIETAPIAAPEPLPNGAASNWRTHLSESTVERVIDALVRSKKPLILAVGGSSFAVALDELTPLEG